jgi:hypothetical protein
MLRLWLPQAAASALLHPPTDYRPRSFPPTTPGESESSLTRLEFSKSHRVPFCPKPDSPPIP